MDAEEWKACLSTVIKNCFHICMKQEVNIGDEERSMDHRLTLESIGHVAKDHGVDFTRVGT